MRLHALIVILGFWIMPTLVGYKIVRDRGRNPVKGMFLCFIFMFAAWLPAIGLWLALKTRDPNTHALV